MVIFTSLVPSSSAVSIWTANIWPASNVSPRAIAWTNNVTTNILLGVYTNYTYAKEAWALDCYSNIVPRIRAAGVSGMSQLTNGIYPAFYRRERDNLSNLRSKALELAAHYVNRGRADGGSLDTFLATNTFLNCLILQDLSNFLSARGLSPTFFTDEIPWRSINTSSGGWDAVRNVITNMQWGAWPVSGFSSANPYTNNQYSASYETQGCGDAISGLSPVFSQAEAWNCYAKAEDDNIGPETAGFSKQRWIYRSASVATNFPMGAIPPTDAYAKFTVDAIEYAGLNLFGDFAHTGKFYRIAEANSYETNRAVFYVGQLTQPALSCGMVSPVGYRMLSDRAHYVFKWDGILPE